MLSGGGGGGGQVRKWRGEMKGGGAGRDVEERAVRVK